MTRKKQIIQAAHEYINSDAVTPENMLLAYGDFINGAKWADKHQPSPWISVEERLPEKVNKFISDEVLVRYIRGGKEYTFVTHYDYEYQTWNIPNVTQWMPIPELLKGDEK